MSSVVALTTDTFEDHVKREGIALIDFWAEWCAPCRAFAPVFEAAADKHADAAFGKLDVDAEPALAGALGIRSIPMLMIFRDGYLVFAQPGMLPAAALDTLLDKVRDLDMEEVKRVTDEAVEQARRGEA